MLNPADFERGFGVSKGRAFDPKKSPLGYIMRKRGWTIAGFALATGVNEDMVRRYVNGKARIKSEHLAAISEALGVPPNALDFIPVIPERVDATVLLVDLYNRIVLGENPQSVFSDVPSHLRGPMKAAIRLIVYLQTLHNLQPIDPTMIQSPPPRGQKRQPVS